MNDEEKKTYQQKHKNENVTQQNPHNINVMQCNFS